MSSIRIDAEKCIGCGRCAADCFPKNIQMVSGKAEVKGPCFMCGHCIAVCPREAVYSFRKDYNMQEVEAFDPEKFLLDREQFSRAVRFRRSVRQYKAQAVDQAVIANILEAGRYTETAGNRQETEYIVVQKQLESLKPLIWEGWRTIIESDQKSLEFYKAFGTRIYQMWKSDPKQDSLFFDAPVLLVVSTPSVLDAGMALTNIEHTANTYGLGMLVSGFICAALQRSPEAKEFLGLTNRPIAACALMGYPSVKYYRTVPRRPARITWQ